MLLWLEGKFIAETLLRRLYRKVRYKQELEKEFIQADKSREWKIKENILKRLEAFYFTRIYKSRCKVIKDGFLIFRR